MNNLKDMPSRLQLLILLGMPKAYTSSLSFYLRDCYNLSFINGIKEPRFFLEKNNKILDKNSIHLDGTQAYLFRDEIFSRISNQNLNYKYLILDNDICLQYERYFNMYYQSSDLESPNQLFYKVINDEFEFDLQFDKEKKLILKEQLKKYKKFVGREITDAEVIHVFKENDPKFMFNEISKLKMQYIIEGDIKNFFSLELKQIRNLEFNNCFSLLPLVILPWVLNWLRKNHELNKIKIIKFKNTDELKSKTDQIMKEWKVDKIKNLDLKYKIPEAELRKKRKEIKLPESFKKILYNLKKKFMKNLNLEF